MAARLSKSRRTAQRVGGHVRRQRRGPLPRSRRAYHPVVLLALCAATLAVSMGAIVLVGGGDLTASEPQPDSSTSPRIARSASESSQDRSPAAPLGEQLAEPVADDIAPTSHASVPPPPDASSAPPRTSERSLTTQDVAQSLTELEDRVCRLLAEGLLEEATKTLRSASLELSGAPGWDERRQKLERMLLQTRHSQAMDRLPGAQPPTSASPTSGAQLTSTGSSGAAGDSFGPEAGSFRQPRPATPPRDTETPADSTEQPAAGQSPTKLATVNHKHLRLTSPSTKKKAKALLDHGVATLKAVQALVGPRPADAPKLAIGIGVEPLRRRSERRPRARVLIPIGNEESQTREALRAALVGEHLDTVAGGAGRMPSGLRQALVAYFSSSAGKRKDLRFGVASRSELHLIGEQAKAGGWRGTLRNALTRVAHDDVALASNGGLQALSLGRFLAASWTARSLRISKALKDACHRLRKGKSADLAIPVALTRQGLGIQRLEGLWLRHAMHGDAWPSKSKVSWDQARVIETPHYRIRSNLEDEHVERYAHFLEALFTQLCWNFKVTGKLQRRCEVWIYKSREEFKSIDQERPAQSAGYYMTSSRRVVTGHGRWGASMETLGVLAHEATHQFQHLASPAIFNHAGTWLTEGLAEYFQASEISGDRMVVGITPLSTLATAKRAVRAGDHLGLAELMRVAQDRFVATHYAQAWAWIYWLIHEKKNGREIFDKCWSRSVQGPMQPTDFEAMIGQLGDLEELERQWQAWLLDL